MSPIKARLAKVRQTIREDGTLRSVLKHTGWLTGSNASILVLSAVQGILTARMLGVTVWGVLGIATSFATVTYLLLSFRMQEFIVKWVTQLGMEEDAKASTAFKLALIADMASALAAFTVVELVAGWGAAAFAKDPQFAWVFRAIALIVVCNAGQETLIGMLHVDRDFRIQSLIQTGSQAAGVCAMAAVYLAGGGVRGVVAVLVGTQALKSLLIWVFGLRAARSVLSAGWMGRELVDFGGLGREMARFAVLGNFRGTLNSVMNWSDLLLLGFLANPAMVGYYKLAQAIAQIANLPNGALVNATFPEFSAAAATRSWSDFRARMRQGSKVAALWLLPVSFGLLLLGRPAIALLYGPDFLPAVPALAILLVGVIVDGILFWGGMALLSLGQPGYLAGISLGGTIAKYALAFLLVPTGGYLALAAVQSAVLISMNVLSSTRVLSSLRAKQSAALAEHH